MLNVIVENCYSCINCGVIKQVCRLKRQGIINIHKDKCNSYSQRKMMKCELCGSYIIGLPQHVNNFHKKTMPEYNIVTRDIDSGTLHIRRKSLWD